MPKASNIRTEEDNVMWDLVDDNDNILVADLITPQETFETDSKQVIDSYVQDTVPAGEEP